MDLTPALVIGPIIVVILPCYCIKAFHPLQERNGFLGLWRLLCEAPDSLANGGLGVDGCAVSQKKLGHFKGSVPDSIEQAVIHVLLQPLAIRGEQQLEAGYVVVKNGACNDLLGP